MHSKKLLYLKDVAAHFGVTPKIVSKWVDDGKLAAVRTPGGHRRIIASDFYTFLDKHYRQAETAPRTPELLIVDDNDSFLELYKLIFRNRKYNVTCCSNGQEALDLFRNTAYDIVLSDIQMPVMDGRQLLKKIRRLHRASKVLLMSNFDIKAEEYHLMGALDCFSKTIGRRELLEKIDVIAGEKRVAKRFDMNRQVILDGDIMCRSLNLSCDGVLVAGNMCLDAGETVQVVINDDDSDMTLKRKARVVRSLKAGDDWHSALYFDDAIGHELAVTMFGAG